MYPLSRFKEGPFWQKHALQGLFPLHLEGAGMIFSYIYSFESQLEEINAELPPPFINLGEC